MDTASQFSWLDYLIFFSMLSLSTIVGVYFAFFGKKQNNTSEYFHGGKTMKILPIAASLIASDISGINILAVPADIYANGSAYILGVISSVVMTIVTLYIFLPVLYKLQLPTVYDYLKLRFDNRICSFVSFSFALILCIYLPVLIYIPAITLQQVSGLQLKIIVPIICFLCVWYTTFGGFRAVVWIDTLQMIIMIGSLFVIFGFGIYVEGGFGNILDNSGSGGRLDFNWDVDPTNNQSSVTILIGLTILLCYNGIHPIFTQRYLAVPTMRDARIAAILLGLGTIFFRLICSFIGLIIYSHYVDCSPLANGAIKNLDNILPYYVMDVSSALPGLPGLFVAGLLSAALGVVSASLNTMSGTIYINLVKPFLPETISDKRSSSIMKVIVVLIGIVITLLVFLVQYLGALLQLSITISGIAIGPGLATFVLGMLVPQVNGKGILVGSISGLIFICWIAFGATYYAFQGHARNSHLPFPSDGCDSSLNNLYSNTPDLRSDSNEGPMYLYRISYYYYSVIGFIITVLIAVPVSLLTGGLKQKVDPKLLCAFVHRFLKKELIENDEKNINDIKVLIENENCDHNK